MCDRLLVARLRVQFRGWGSKPCQIQNIDRFKTWQIQNPDRFKALTDSDSFILIHFCPLVNVSTKWVHSPYIVGEKVTKQSTGLRKMKLWTLRTHEWLSQTSSSLRPRICQWCYNVVACWLFGSLLGLQLSVQGSVPGCLVKFKFIVESWLSDFLGLLLIIIIS